MEQPSLFQLLHVWHSSFWSSNALVPAGHEEEVHEFQISPILLSSVTQLKPDVFAAYSVSMSPITIRKAMKGNRVFLGYKTRSRFGHDEISM